MYGESMKTPFRTGVTECSLRDFSLSVVNTEKYSGPALSLQWVTSTGAEESDRIFPIDVEKLRDAYRRNADKFGNMTEDAFVASKGRELTWQIESILKAFVPPQDVVQLLGSIRDFQAESGDPKTSTQASREVFVKFVSLAVNLLNEKCPNYKDVVCYICRGYEKNQTRHALPKAPSQSILISLEPFTFEGSKAFKLHPWGPQIEAANATAGPQTQTGKVEF